MKSAFGKSSFVAALALVAGSLTAGRTDAGVVGYAYAEQMISRVTIAPTTGGTAFTLVAVNPANPTPNPAYATSASAVIDGFTADATNGTTDTNQAFTGNGSAPGENTFGQANTFPGGPTNSRGDAVIDLTPGATAASAVAETLLDSDDGSVATGVGRFTAKLNFTVDANSALTISYDYINSLIAQTQAGAVATAAYTFVVTIKDAQNNSFLNFSPTVTNDNLSSPPNGPTLNRNGTQTVTSAELTAGTVYTLDFSGTTSTSVQAQAAAVPEPSTVISLVAALPVIGLAIARRRRAA